MRRLNLTLSMLVLLAEHPSVEGREEMKGKGNNVTNFLARSADNSQKDQKLIYLCRANHLGICESSFNTLRL